MELPLSRRAYQTGGISKPHEQAGKARGPGLQPGGFHQPITRNETAATQNASMVNAAGS
jgi:hypothetical protein